MRSDSTPTTPTDLGSGRVDLGVGFAPLRPGEFSVLPISHPTAAPCRVRSVSCLSSPKSRGDAALIPRNDRAGRRRSAVALLSLVIGGLASGCGAAGRAPPARPVAAPLAEPPGFAATVDGWVGTPLSGPLGEDAAALVPADPQQALALEARILLVDSMARIESLLAERRVPDGGSTRLRDQLVLVVDLSRSASPGVTSRHANNGCLVRGPPARELFGELARSAPSGALSIAAVEEVVVRGVTTRLACRSADGGRFAVAVHGRGTGSAEVTLELAASGGGVELVKLAGELTAGGDPLLVVVPSPLSWAEERGCALLLDLQPAPGEAAARERHAAVVAAALARSVRAPDPAATHALPGQVDLEGARAALLRLVGDDSARATLVELGADAGAELFLDLALVASDPVLAALADAIASARPDLLRGGDPPESLGWGLEREAWRFLAGSALHGELEPELSAQLLRHAGAAGAWPATIEDFADDRSDGARFNEQLIAENLRLLADHSAALRVRAFDWLAARGVAPKGFDPLAPAAKRRAVLESREHAGD